VRAVPSNTIANPSAATSVTSKPMESSTQQKVPCTCGREGFQREQPEQRRHQLPVCLLGVGPGPKLELTTPGCQQSQETLNQGLEGCIGAEWSSVLAWTGTREGWEMHCGSGGSSFSDAAVGRSAVH